MEDMRNTYKIVVNNCCGSPRHIWEDNSNTLVVTGETVVEERIINGS
jgi:hypothetical protein